MAPLPRRARGLRASALLALLLFLPTGCGFWRTVPATSVTGGDVPVKGEELRFRLPGDPRLWHLEVERVELPFVEGLAWSQAAGGAASGGSAGAEPPALLRLDLRSLELVEVETPGRGLALSTGAALGVAAAVYAAAVWIILHSWNPRVPAARPTP